MSKASELQDKIDLSDCRAELEKTPDDLSVALEENNKLTAQLETLERQVEAMKPRDDEALAKHIQALDARCKQAEALLLAFTVATKGHFTP